jgi:flagellar biosynthesis protein FlhA
MLCSARVRRHLRKLVEARLPQLAVCSYNEVAPGVGVETVAVLGNAARETLPVV